MNESVFTQITFESVCVWGGGINNIFHLNLSGNKSRFVHPTAHWTSHPDVKGTSQIYRVQTCTADSPSLLQARSILLVVFPFKFMEDPYLQLLELKTILFFLDFPCSLISLMHPLGKSIFTSLKIQVENLTTLSPLLLLPWFLYSPGLRLKPPALCHCFCSSSSYPQDGVIFVKLGLDHDAYPAQCPKVAPHSFQNKNQHPHHGQTLPQSPHRVSHSQTPVSPLTFPSTTLPPPVTAL